MLLKDTSAIDLESTLGNQVNRNNWDWNPLFLCLSIKSSMSVREKTWSTWRSTSEFYIYKPRSLSLEGQSPQPNILLQLREFQELLQNGRQTKEERWRLWRQRRQKAQNKCRILGWKAGFDALGVSSPESNSQSDGIGRNWQTLISDEKSKSINRGHGL